MIKLLQLQHEYRIWESERNLGGNSVLDGADPISGMEEQVGLLCHFIG
jgi:hypothetical protein